MGVIGSPLERGSEEERGSHLPCRERDAWSNRLALVCKLTNREQTSMKVHIQRSVAVARWTAPHTRMITTGAGVARQSSSSQSRPAITRCCHVATHHFPSSSINIKSSPQANDLDMVHNTSQQHHGHGWVRALYPSMTCSSFSRDCRSEQQLQTSGRGRWPRVGARWLVYTYSRTKNEI
jgi:hypothetical protein